MALALGLGAQSGVESISEFLIQNSDLKLELEAIGSLAEGQLNKIFPRYHQAIIFAIFLRISYFPSHVLGTDYCSTPWKHSLYIQALELVETIKVLPKTFSTDSVDQTLQSCIKIQKLWGDLIHNYFNEVFRPGNDWNEESSPYRATSSYRDDEYPMTTHQLQLAQANPLSLEQEMKSTPEADIILIAAGSYARADQQYPKFIQKLALAHPDHKIKIFMIDPFFTTMHPKSITSDWTAIDNEGKPAEYSNRFIKGNVEAIICRQGFTCMDSEFELIKSYLSTAMDQGSEVFLGNHCSNVSSYLNELFNELKKKYSAPNKLTMYDEHGGGIVSVWRKNLYDSKESAILEMILKSKLKPKKDFESEVKKLKYLSETEKQKIIADYRNGQLNVGYELSHTMDDLSF